MEMEWTRFGFWGGVTFGVLDWGWIWRVEQWEWQGKGGCERMTFWGFEYFHG